MLLDTNNVPQLDSKQILWLYNAIDCCVTQDVLAETKQQLDPLSAMVYKFEMAQWAPALEMMIRGLKVDREKRQEIERDLTSKREKIAHILDIFSHAVWDRPLNHNSPKQLQDFFYGVMKLPEQHKIDKGVRKVSTDREALEKLWPYLYARPIVNCILALRDIDKKLSVVTMKLCPDGRFRCSYNPSGTETGRWSSSASAFRTGSNSQNITDELRVMLVADPGFKIGYADLEQAESRGVAYITGDEDYIRACESGDLHTTVAKMIWPRLPWPHTPKGDRELADQIFYRYFSRRDISKRCGHGCVTEDHEVLTPNGWVSIATKPSVIMTWDGTTSYFTTVTNWTDKLYTGKMVEILGTSVSINMTADHRVILTKDRKGCKLYEIPAEKFSTVRGDIPLGSGYSESGSSMVVRDYLDTVRVLCPTVASGMFYIKRQGKIHITGNSNYRGKPPHMAKILKVQRQLIEEFQENYFQAFPGIPAWHQTTASELHSNGCLTTPLGRRRFFLGRRFDDATLREAIAYRPQSTIVDILNIGLWRLWKANIVRLHGQIHDAVLFQYPAQLENEILPQVLELLKVKVPINGRILEIPVEVSVGWNWAKFNDKESKGPLNPYGIRKWNGSDDRTPPPTGFALLDRLVR